MKIALRVKPEWESPKGRLLVLEIAAPSTVGTTTLAASSAVSASSMTSEKRFCSTQPRHSTW